MNNNPVGNMCLGCGSSWSDERLEIEKRLRPNLISCCPDRKVVPVYAKPTKDREKDRLRFNDEAFNRWLDESISDSGHTVYDQINDICDAWHGWFNSQFYENSKKLDWGDREDEWSKEIQKAHPLNTGFFNTYDTACEMVHNRHGKFALVALVNWLLRKVQEK